MKIILHPIHYYRTAQFLMQTTVIFLLSIAMTSCKKDVCTDKLATNVSKSNPCTFNPAKFYLSTNTIQTAQPGCHDIDHVIIAVDGTALPGQITSSRIFQEPPQACTLPEGLIEYYVTDSELHEWYAEIHGCSNEQDTIFYTSGKFRTERDNGNCFFIRVY